MAAHPQQSTPLHVFKDVQADFRLDPRVKAQHAKLVAGSKVFPKRVMTTMIMNGFAMNAMADQDPTPSWAELQAADAAKRAELRQMLVEEDCLEAYEDFMNVGASDLRATLAPLGEGLAVSQHTAVGVDGNHIPLCIIRPDSDTVLPCVYYCHGGGMGHLSMANPAFQSFGRLIARQGVAVCLVEFRNSM
jgi:acetyl esterase/lipase